MKILFTLAVFIASVFCVHGQSPDIPVMFMVKADESIKLRMNNCLGAELRKLKDISLTKPEPQFVLAVLAQKRSGVVAFAVTVIERVDYRSILDLKEFASVPQESKDTVKYGLKYNKHAGNYLNTGSDAQLEYICRDMITGIDKEIFQKERDFHAAYDQPLDERTEQEKWDESDGARRRGEVDDAPDLSDLATNKPKTESPFTATYVGGNKLPTATIENNTDRLLTLVINGATYKIAAQKTLSLNFDSAGNVTYKASALGVTSLQGVDKLERGYSYSWTFYIR